VFHKEERDDGQEQALVAGTMVLQDRTKEGLHENTVKIIESSRKKMENPVLPLNKKDWLQAQSFSKAHAAGHCC
jgi:hypothetical protein